MALTKQQIKQHEAIEKIDYMGQDSEVKAAKWVKEEFAEVEKKEQEIKEEQLDTLQKKRKLVKIFAYKEQLSIYMAEMIQEENIPVHWHWKIEITDKGLKLKVADEKRKEKVERKFAITGEPKYDFHACMQFAYWVGDHIYYKEHKEKENKSGLILPHT